MGKWFREHHTRFLWGVAVVIGFLAMINTATLGTLEERIERQSDTLAQPQIAAGIVPGIPADLVGELKSASQGIDDPARAGHLWLTVQLANTGFGEADRVAADIRMEPALDKRFALSHDGENTGEKWGGPQVVAPKDGTGPGAFEVEFDSLPVGESHWVFLGLRPDGYGAPPYSPEERRRWSGAYRQALDRMVVTASGGEGPGATRTRTVYGFETVTATPQAGTAPGTDTGTDAGTDTAPETEAGKAPG